MHYPVMAAEVLEFLRVRPDGVYIDATAGLGGHSAAIARRLRNGRLACCDRDGESLEMARAAAAAWADRIVFLHTPFSALSAALRQAGFGPADGLLADLGVSRYQLTEPERGFSLQHDGPLDMRMDRGQRLTAADIVNFSSERELADLIFQKGEERGARRIARAIVRARPIRSTRALAQVIESVVPRTGRLSPATLTFMALRIAVNREDEELEALLEALPELAAPGGRVVIVSFMSLEDRAVKRRFQNLVRQGRAQALTRHVVRPSVEELDMNPASRSARLRALEMRE